MHEKEIRKNGKLIVSVPYRGYSFFNEFQPDKIKIAVKFPSLTGVIRFLIGIVGGEWQIDIAEFPSLTGVIRFLILPSKARMATGLKIRFAGQNYF